MSQPQQIHIQEPIKRAGHNEYHMQPLLTSQKRESLGAAARRLWLAALNLQALRLGPLRASCQTLPAAGDQGTETTTLSCRFPTGPNIVTYINSCAHSHKSSPRVNPYTYTDCYGQQWCAQGWEVGGAKRTLK